MGVEACSFALLDQLFTIRPWIVSIANACIVFIFWPGLERQFSLRKATMESFADAIRIPAAIDGLWADKWKLVRHVCAVWYAGREFERLHDRYNALKFLVPIGLFVGIIVGAIVSAAPQSPGGICNGVTANHLTTLAIYAGLIASIVVARRLQAGLSRVSYDVQRGAMGIF